MILPLSAIWSRHEDFKAVSLPQNLWEAEVGCVPWIEILHGDRQVLRCSQHGLRSRRRSMFWVHGRYILKPNFNRTWREIFWLLNVRWKSCLTASKPHIFHHRRGRSNKENRPIDPVLYIVHHLFKTEKVQCVKFYDHGFFTIFVLSYYILAIRF